jgi:hypothetical protein
MNTHKVADGSTVNGQRPGKKPDAVESVHALGLGREPEEAVQRLRNRIHAGRRGAILDPPGAMQILGNTQVGIERVNRA